MRTHIIRYAKLLVVVDEQGKLPLVPGSDEWLMTWDRWPELRPLLRPMTVERTGLVARWQPRSRTGRDEAAVPLWQYEHERVGDIMFRDDNGMPNIACFLDDEGCPLIAGWGVA